MSLPTSTTIVTCLPRISALDNRSVYLDVYAGQRCPNVMFSKTDVAQDGCTVICRNTQCYKIGTHRCAACERESYCSEDCRRQDRPRHVEDCQRNAIASRLSVVKHFDRTSSCQGISTRNTNHGNNKACPNKVVSFCRHCEATVCHQWECSKFHLEQCSAYVEAKLEREWVLITMLGKGQVKGKNNGGTGEEEEWVVVEKNLP